MRAFSKKFEAGPSGSASFLFGACFKQPFPTRLRKFLTAMRDSYNFCALSHP